MDIFQIVAAGIIGGILAIIIKGYSPVFALMISLMVSILIFVMVLPNLSALMGLISRITALMGHGQDYVLVIVKIIGIAYVAEFGAQICQDAGEGSIAAKIELAGKVLIMGVAAPVIISLVEQVVSII